MFPSHQHDAHKLVAYLGDNDAPCPLCGYNLRNHTSARCPECGHTIEVTLRIADRLHTAWLLALVVAATSLGLTAFLVLRLLSGFRPTSSTELILAGGLFLLTLAAGLLPFIRRMFIRLPLPLQWLASLLIVIVWFITAGCFILSL